MTPQVEPNFNEKIDCPCGCGLFGATKRAHKDGVKHVRRCVCRQCKGRQVKHASGNRERRIARRLGGERAALSGALTGYDIRVPLRGGSFVLIEETTNVAFWRGALAWWNGKGTQHKLARLLAQKNGLRMALGPDLAVMPRADAEALLQIAGDEQ
jgi:hypothetical protein